MVSVVHRVENAPRPKMTRSAEWVVERAVARVAGRVKFSTEIETGDVVLRWNDGGDDISFMFPASWWSDPQNSDESVHKKINRMIDRWLGFIGRKMAEMKITDKALLEQLKLAPAADVVAQMMPSPQPRRRGRPPKNRTPEPEPEYVDTGDEGALEMQQ